MLRKKLLKYLFVILATTSISSCLDVGRVFTEQTGTFGITYNAPSSWIDYPLGTDKDPIAVNNWGQFVDAPTLVFYLIHNRDDCTDPTFSAQINPLVPRSRMTPSEARSHFATKGDSIRSGMDLVSESTEDSLMEMGLFQSVLYRETYFQYYTKLNCAVSRFDAVLNDGTTARLRTSDCPLGEHSLSFTLIYDPTRQDLYIDIADAVIESVRWME